MSKHLKYLQVAHYYQIHVYQMINVKTIPIIALQLIRQYVNRKTV